MAYAVSYLEAARLSKEAERTMLAETSRSNRYTLQLAALKRTNFGGSIFAEGDLYFERTLLLRSALTSLNELSEAPG